MVGGEDGGYCCELRDCFCLEECQFSGLDNVICRVLLTLVGPTTISVIVVVSVVPGRTVVSRAVLVSCKVCVLVMPGRIVVCKLVLVRTRVFVSVLTVFDVLALTTTVEVEVFDTVDTIVVNLVDAVT